MTHVATRAPDIVTTRSQLVRWWRGAKTHGWRDGWTVSNNGVARGGAESRANIEEGLLWRAAAQKPVIVRGGPGRRESTIHAAS